MLAIPLPVLIKMKLPLRKKIVLVAVFSVGIFVILSAILNKYYSFTYPYGAEWTFWYTREISTAVLVTNIPHCWALLRRFFNLRSFLSGGTHNTASRSASVAPRDTPGSPRERSQRSSMQNAGHTNRAAMADNRWHPRTDSQEFITVPLNMQGQPESNPPRRNLPLEIWQNRVIEVRVDDATDIRRSRAHSLDSSDLESQMPVADIPPDGIHTTITATGR